MSWIRDDELRIENGTPALARELRAAGFRARQRSRSGQRSAETLFVLFDPEVRPFYEWRRPGYYLRSPTLVALVTWLSEHGLAFKEVPQADASPARYMRFLQERGDFEGPFLEDRWDFAEPRSVDTTELDGWL